jgi:hypothetical protein
MTVAYRLERFRGSGTVFIAWLEGDLYYSGYWDSFPEEDPPTALEQMPETPSIVEAVAWGRGRTPRVLIRPESDPEEYYWAGLGQPRGDDANLKRLDV